MKLSSINPFVRYAAHDKYRPYLENTAKYGCDNRILLVESGGLSVTFGGETHTIASGGAFFSPSGRPYEMRTVGETFVYVVNFDFTDEYANFETPQKPLAFDGTLTQDIYKTEAIEDTSAFSSHFTLHFGEKLRNELAVITEEFAGKKIFFRERCSSSAKSLLVLAARAMETHAAASSAERIADEAIRYIGENLHRSTLCNADIATALNYHSYYISSVMTDFTGMPLHKYIFSRRISAACELLLDGGLSVKETAYRTGFKSQSQFSAAFRKAIGISPSKYGRRHEIEG